MAEERYASYKYVEADQKWGSCAFPRCDTAIEKAERLLQSRSGLKEIEVWSLIAVVRARPIETIVESIWRDKPEKEED